MRLRRPDPRTDAPCCIQRALRIPAGWPTCLCVAVCSLRQRGQTAPAKEKPYDKQRCEPPWPPSLLDRATCLGDKRATDGCGFEQLHRRTLPRRLAQTKAPDRGVGDTRLGVWPVKRRCRIMLPQSCPVPKSLKPVRILNYGRSAGCESESRPKPSPTPTGWRKTPRSPRPTRSKLVCLNFDQKGRLWTTTALTDIFGQRSLNIARLLFSARVLHSEISE